LEGERLKIEHEAQRRMDELRATEVCVMFVCFSFIRVCFVNNVYFR